MSDAPQETDYIKYIYHFDGSGGCDTCSALTGWYDDRPERPHPNCQCNITEWIYIGKCELFYEALSDPEETEDEELVFYGTIENNSEVKAKFKRNVSAEYTGEVSVSAGIENVFSVSGKYSETHKISEEVEVELEPGQSVDIIISVKWVTVSFRAQEKWKCEMFFEDEDLEVEGEEIEEEIRIPKGTHVVLE